MVRFFELNKKYKIKKKKNTPPPPPPIITKEKRKRKHAYSWMRLYCN